MRPPCLSVLCIDSVNVEEFRTSQRGNAPKAVRRTPLSSPAPMTSSYRLPNFLVLGAAKSGTTWLHEELGRHPDIFMSVLAGYGVYTIGLIAYKIRLRAIEDYGPVIHEFDPYFNYRATEVRKKIAALIVGFYLTREELIPCSSY